jgi:uncharacterized protein YggE
MNEYKKGLLNIAIIVTLLTFSYAAISFVRSYDKTIEPSNFRSFSVTGEGSVVTVPDIASFSFTVISEGSTDLASLQADNAKKNNEINTFLKEQGIDPKDIKTSAYNVSPRYEQCYAYREPSGVCPPPKIVGYTVSQTTEVKIRDFEIIGDTLAGVVTSGANSVSQLLFTIDDETAIQEQAREEAIAKAQEKAKQIAQAAGFGVGKLLDITEGYAYPYQAKYTYAAMDMVAAEGSYAPSVEAGSQEVTVTVTLTYEIQ